MKRDLYPFGSIVLALLILIVQTAKGQAPGPVPESKVSPALYGIFVEKREKPSADLRYYIVTPDLPAFRRFAGKLPGRPRVLREYPALGIAEISASYTSVRRMLASELVSFVDLASRIPREELSVPGLDLSVNRINTVHAAYPELDGRGLTVSIKESRYDSNDIDLRGRHAASSLESKYLEPHASLMATMIGGAGNSGIRGRGAANAVRLSSADFISLLPEDDVYYGSLGISVQNHSYGVGIENFYGVDAAAYDASVVLRPSLLHVFSAGNIGESTGTSGPYRGVPGYANLTGSFKMAKNALVIGAVNQTGALEARSSRGPAYDGRVKPDLVAFGRDGSSGAAALVSGISVLLQQAYRNREGSLPPAALVRAVLVAGADEYGDPGPDYGSGFGNVNAGKAIRAIQEGRYLAGAVARGQERRYRITVPGGAGNLRMSLAWTDALTAPNASRALVNDLDLELLEPGAGVDLAPWVLSPLPDEDSLSRPALRGRDSLNNIELITLDAPQAGVYEVVVRGRRISAGEQAFYVAFSWDGAGRLDWAFPVEGTALAAGDSVFLRWESTLPEPIGHLELSFDDDGEWQQVEAEVSLAEGNYLWRVPDTTAIARFRLRTTDGDVFYSGSFSINPLPVVRTGFNCSESLLLYWPSVPQAEAYELSGLRGSYLEPLATLSDTSVIIDKTQRPGTHFAVTPILPGGRRGLRSAAVNPAVQGVGCYLRSFLAGLSFDPDEVRLTLSLGAIYQVKSIIFEKRRAGGLYRSIHEVAPATGLSYEYLDGDLETGVNIYRARIALAGGEFVTSEEITIFYPGRQAFLLFPNPSSRGQGIRVISRPTESFPLLRLYDSTGREVLRLSLTGTFEDLPLQNLPAGLYFYRITEGGEEKQQGKLVLGY